MFLVLITSISNGLNYELIFFALVFSFAAVIGEVDCD